MWTCCGRKVQIGLEHSNKTLKLNANVSQQHFESNTLRLAERGEDGILQTATMQVRLVFFSSVHDGSTSVDSVETLKRRPRSC